MKTGDVILFQHGGNSRTYLMLQSSTNQDWFALEIDLKENGLPLCTILSPVTVWAELHKDHITTLFNILLPIQEVLKSNGIST